MIPLGSSLFIAAALAVLCFLLAWIDGDGRIGKGTWTKVWIGETPPAIARRVAWGTLAFVALAFNSYTCWGSCSTWHGLTSILLYIIAVIGGGRSAAVYGAVYVFTTILWVNNIGGRAGPVLPILHFGFFLGSIALLFVRLREHVSWIGRIPLPAWWVDVADRTQRAWRAMGQSPSNVQVSRSQVRSQARTARRVTEGNPPAPAASRVLPASLAASDLYLGTLLIEGGAALVRSALYFVASLVVLSPFYLFLFWSSRNNYLMPAVGFWGGQTGEWTPDYMRWLTTNLTICLVTSAVIGLVLGCWPLGRSLFHMGFPYTRSGAGEDERDTLGAREPTRAERQKIIDTLETVRASATIEMAAPSYWFVMDAPMPDAYTIGSTVYVTSAAIEDSHFAGIVAHELGHVAHKDGDLILALRRFVIPLAYFIGVDRQPTPAGTVMARGTGISSDVIRNEDEKIFYRFKALQIKLFLAFWTGGLGLFFLGRQWARFWRRRDFLADDYAVQLGQADSLMGILSTHRHSDVAQPFLLSSRPYTAERLDRLQG